MSEELAFYYSKGGGQRLLTIKNNQENENIVCCQFHNSTTNEWEDVQESVDQVINNQNHPFNGFLQSVIGNNGNRVPLKAYYSTGKNQRILFNERGEAQGIQYRHHQGAQWSSPRMIRAQGMHKDLYEAFEREQSRQQRASYPPQQGGHPQQQGGYPPQQGGYPPQQGGYPPQQGGYPPQQGGYPPQQGGYPPQQGGYPPQQGHHYQQSAQNISDFKAALQGIQLPYLEFLDDVSRFTDKVKPEKRVDTGPNGGKALKLIFFDPNDMPEIYDIFYKAFPGNVLIEHTDTGHQQLSVFCGLEEPSAFFSKNIKLIENAYSAYKQEREIKDTKLQKSVVGLFPFLQNNPQTTASMKMNLNGEKILSLRFYDDAQKAKALQILKTALPNTDIRINSKGQLTVNCGKQNPADFFSDNRRSIYETAKTSDQPPQMPRQQR